MSHIAQMYTAQNYGTMYSTVVWYRNTEYTPKKLYLYFCTQVLSYTWTSFLGVAGNVLKNRCFPQPHCTSMKLPINVETTKKYAHQEVILLRSKMYGTSRNLPVHRPRSITNIWKKSIIRPTGHYAKTLNKNEKFLFMKKACLQVGLAKRMELWQHSHLQYLPLMPQGQAHLFHQCWNNDDSGCCAVGQLSAK